jgi:UDP-N-acetylmuramate--alanine ligase
LKKKASNNDLDKYRRFYLIGIGGAGMSAIATVLAGMGFYVEGSDLKRSRYTLLLEEKGINVHIGHDRKNISDIDAVIYSAAISPDNVELSLARKKNIPVFTRGEILSWILNNNKGIAVTGTHGKTTTTSMIALILRGLELDPTIMIGGELNELGTNARFGKGEYVIAEACESDGTFLLYRPFIGVITNIEEDHMDYWKDFSQLKDSFGCFIKNIRNDGFVVINGDEPELMFMKTLTEREVITFGIEKHNDIYAENVNLSNYSSSFELVFNRVKNAKGRVKASGPSKRDLIKIPVRLIVPGIHNVKNSLAALAVCWGLGLDIKKCVQIMQYFTGAKRRFEKRGEKKGAVIFDDYAHHPTEVRVTLETALLEKKGRIITVFQPHRYSRLSTLHDRFKDCFSNTDILIITDVFASDERPIPGVTGKLLVDSLLDEGFPKKVVYIPNLVDVNDFLDSIIKKDDIVLIMGAGDITRVSEELLKV